VNRRPASGEKLRLRGGCLVTVRSPGMKYIRCTREGVATSFLVAVKDLVELPVEDVQSIAETKPKQRPTASALDEEFLGDLSE
jgi:hypothetical protein